MRIKQGAIIAGLKSEMRPVLIAAEKVWKAQGKMHDHILQVEVDLSIEGVTITSGLDGCHNAESYHPFGWALDLRTRYFSNEQWVNKVADTLRLQIHEEARHFPQYYKEYQVVVESDHIHVEYEGDK